MSYEDDEEFVPTRPATFLRRIWHQPDSVRELFWLELPLERNVLSLETNTILPDYYELVMVSVTANPLLHETVVYGYALDGEDVTSTRLGLLRGVADVVDGLRRIGYVAKYPAGEGPVRVPSTAGP